MKLGYASLDEVPENFRGICKVENGVVLLDESKLKTQADVDAVVEAKRKEVTDHNATKAKLATWLKLGESPDSVATQISDLQSREGNANEQTERIAALQRDVRKLTGERDGFKADLDKIKPDYDGMKKQIHNAKISEVLDKSIAALNGIDAVKLKRFLLKDAQLGFIDLDESGEGLIVKSGERFSDYAMANANDLGFKLSNTPGQSSPGVSKIPNDLKTRQPAAEVKSDFLDDNEKNLLDK